MVSNTEVVGSFQRLYLRPQGDLERTILHNLISHLSDAKSRVPTDKVYVSEANYGFGGLEEVVLTNTTPIRKW